MEVRILAHWTDDPLQSPMTLDIRIDPRTRRMIGQWSVFGVLSIGAKESRPFVLDDAGIMDFGVFASPADRTWQCDIRNCEIAVGAQFKVVWSGGDHGFYRIVRVAELGSKTERGAR